MSKTFSKCNNSNVKSSTNRNYKILILLLALSIVTGSIIVQVSASSDFETNPALSAENSLAMAKAKSYLEIMSFSKQRLIEQLEFDGFSHDDATYAIENINVDWNKQALASATNYLEMMAFSKQSLIDQLEFDGFTHEEALYGVDNSNADWKEQAAIKAKSYLEFMKFSKAELIDQLEFDGFTKEEAVYGFDNYDIDLESHNISAPINTSNTEVTEKLNAYLQEPPNDNNMTIDKTDMIVSDEMLKVLIKNLDNIFPIRGMEEGFTHPQVATYSDVGTATAVQIETQNGTRNIWMFANADSLHDYSSVSKINAGNLHNFYFSMDVIVNDVYPENQGGCFIGYVNEPVNNKQTLDTVSTISLLLSDSNILMNIKEKDADKGFQTRLSAFTGKGITTRISIIRLTGSTLFFVNDKLIGQYHDGKSGPFQLEYGASVFSNGDTAKCSFDNLEIRKVVK